jgi:hypothetical protein
VEGNDVLNCRSALWGIANQDPAGFQRYTRDRILVHWVLSSANKQKRSQLSGGGLPFLM